MTKTVRPKSPLKLPERMSISERYNKDNPSYNDAFGEGFNYCLSQVIEALRQAGIKFKEIKL